MKLLLHKPSHLMHNTHNYKELWSAVGNACGCNSHRCISDFGPPFNYMDVINKFFFSIASHPDYKWQFLSHIDKF
jgi:hypothetical protein